jgi:ATP-dependent Clp protease adaptor protein ClpS
MDGEQQGCTGLLPAVETKPRKVPLWHVVLLDDDDHTYDYVIEMLGRLFHLDSGTAYLMACEVDGVGSVIVETTVLERAEFKRDQIRAYGRDWRLDYSHGSMGAILQPAAGEEP